MKRCVIVALSAIMLTACANTATDHTVSVSEKAEQTEQKTKPLDFSHSIINNEVWYRSEKKNGDIYGGIEISDEDAIKITHILKDDLIYIGEEANQIVEDKKYRGNAIKNSTEPTSLYWYDIEFSIGNTVFIMDEELLALLRFEPPYISINIDKTKSKKIYDILDSYWEE